MYIYDEIRIIQPYRLSCIGFWRAWHFSLS